MSYANGGGSNGYSTPKGAPIPAHDLSGQSQFSNGYTYGANPPPGWSQYVGPDHKAPPPVATQLVVPSELSDTQVTLTCYNCQQHVTTTTKTGPSPWTWAWCCCLCTFVRPMQIVNFTSGPDFQDTPGTSPGFSESLCKEIEMRQEMAKNDLHEKNPPRSIISHKRLFIPQGVQTSKKKGVTFSPEVVDLVKRAQQENLAKRRYFMAIRQKTFTFEPKVANPKIHPPIKTSEWDLASHMDCKRLSIIIEVDFHGVTDDWTSHGAESITLKYLRV
ncbi:hypothetical protein TCAL_14473 [Tigriopus californicus]|uniref:LITAF domain-containing protein n=1 Tax=Tigriopus californicus TaxID=6832 RepID=A0A553PTT3_TIGCA|nr:hypothetical protein TCAL_14473 [Tigriopus californicus]